ncbi:hypothetical protein P3T36_001140 [Kitasatospora sp. MAP12-15]|uniref:hypothetical protein n=1 Tax=unclassified Kitasatospora TaxID=2633591 RepID=UPI0024759B9C|nr:hypothetical protein [Kitasatospora sp. MAP12-44]MDH6114789.1 hypothetical protein [Kitasatospora sp. MAP12-44]
MKKRTEQRITRTRAVVVAVGVAAALIGGVGAAAAVGTPTAIALGSGPDHTKSTVGWNTTGA